MRFEDFARQFGLKVNGLVPGKWVAVPTEDHPQKRNGRYKWLGHVGWAQNWATMEAPEMWKDSEERDSVQVIRRALQDSARERMQAIQRAASKAGWILHQCVNEFHPYLEHKGFPEEAGNVWTPEPGKPLLVIPMRVDGKLVGCQLVDSDGNKKFLQGQQTKGASFVMDAKGIPIFCEGYATGLSIRAIMRAMKVRYTIHVAFSAGNIQEVARGVPGGFVVADFDKSGTGEEAARRTGKPYWLSDTVGEDFNDFHCRVGLFKATASLKRTLMNCSASVAA